MADAHDVKDSTLAHAGDAGIARAAEAMPVLAAVGERMARERSLDGIRVGAWLPLTPTTAALIRALAGAGARVALGGPDLPTTGDDVAAVLADCDGITVHAHGEGDDAFYDQLEAVADHRPQVVLDAGGDLLGLIHAARREVLDGVIAGVEETAIGVERLRDLEDDGVLSVPVIAVDEARSARLFDARFGSGRSVLDAIVRLGGVELVGRPLLVVGYGWSGHGLAVHAREAGARVIVAEVDPLRALQAVADGFEVHELDQAVTDAEIIVTATGTPRVVDGDLADRLRDGAILCNAGHAAIEIDVPALRDRAVTVARPRPDVEEIRFADGRHVKLLADGYVLDRALGGEPSPTVLDVRCAIQALAVEYAVRHAEMLESRVYVVPQEIDEQAARLGLDALGVTFGGTA